MYKRQQHAPQFNLKLIIAPHEISEERLQEIERCFAGKILRYSTAIAEKTSSANILIIDNIGMLSSLYGHGKIAYVGGGFGKGIHNTLEAAVFGVPVIFGHKHQKFQEAVDLVECGAAFSVNSFDDFERILLNLIKNERERTNSGNAAKNYVFQNAGGIKAIMDYLETNLLLVHEEQNV